LFFKENNMEFSDTFIDEDGMAIDLETENNTNKAIKNMDLVKYID